MDRICKKFFVSGKVQGVFFRDGACKKAKELDITGWVRNLNDGRVELLACGLIENINTLETWLWQGTTTSKVEKVEQQDIAFETHQNFVIMCSDQF